MQQRDGLRGTNLESFPRCPTRFRRSLTTKSSPSKSRTGLLRKQPQSGDCVNTSSTTNSMVDVIESLATYTDNMMTLQEHQVLLCHYTSMTLARSPTVWYRSSSPHWPNRRRNFGEEARPCQHVHYFGFNSKENWSFSSK